MKKKIDLSKIIEKYKQEFEIIKNKIKNPDNLINKIPMTLVKRAIRFFTGYWASNSVNDELPIYLYSLVRNFKPQLVLESGTYIGYSTSFLAYALAKNKFGSLTTIDTASRSGQVIPKELKSNLLLLRNSSSIDVLRNYLKPSRICFFSDSVHTYDYVKGELDLVLSYKLKKGSLILIHDANVLGVRKAFFESLGKEWGKQIILFKNKPGLAIGVKIK